MPPTVALVLTVPLGAPHTWSQQNTARGTAAATLGSSPVPDPAEGPWGSYFSNLSLGLLIF